MPCARSQANPADQFFDTPGFQRLPAGGSFCRTAAFAARFPQHGRKPGPQRGRIAVMVPGVLCPAALARSSGRVAFPVRGCTALPFRRNDGQERLPPHDSGRHGPCPLPRASRTTRTCRHHAGASPSYGGMHTRLSQKMRGKSFLMGAGLRVRSPARKRRPKIDLLRRNSACSDNS